MTRRTQVELGLELPSVPAERDACVQRLVNHLQAKEGIEFVHKMEQSHSSSGKYCVHYDPRRVTVAEVRRLVHLTGAELDRRYGHLLLQAVVMHPRQARTAESLLQRLDGMTGVDVSPSGIVHLEFDRQKLQESTVLAAVANAGITLVEEKIVEVAAQKSPPGSPDHTREEVNGHEHGGSNGTKGELLLAACSGTLLALGLLTTRWVPQDSVTATSAWIASYFCGGYGIAHEAWGNLRARRFEIDFLMLVAAIGTAALGNWFEGALLLFLFSIGHALERHAMSRAKHAIEALGELAPPSALVRRDGELRIVKLAEIIPGDVAIIKPNERIPSDGVVIQGSSSVNQAPITGESMPVDKRSVDDAVQAVKDFEQVAAEHRVFAGTINQSGALEVYVTRAAADSTLARVVKMVREAATQKSPTQRFTDQFERYFVPAVLLFTTLLLFAWVLIDEPFSRSFYRAMAVLVAASPCALAISTPSAVLSGVARAARGGVLVKGGGPLESLGALHAIAFDKTGTLTQGKPKLLDVLAADGVTVNELLRVVIAVEVLSDHPLAAAVVQGGRERLGKLPVPQARDLQSITGRGIKAQIEGQQVVIGNHELFLEINGPPLPAAQREQVRLLESQGRSTMIVRYADQYLGVLGLMDTPRAGASATIVKLRSLGVQRLIMLSGDNQQVAGAVAKQLGLDEAWGDLMPAKKVEFIKQLAQYGGVAMVGDGVND
ncbi:MAG: heavy metal translocating P-type ATPase, partial [Planctomycetaceae bacterium]|nr:heavy metal translocating P-type ATPase [Planctomycetaceae bacterium]